MTTHWLEQYLGEPYAPDKNCFYWYCRISKEQFGRDIQPVLLDQRRFHRSAMELLRNGHLATTRGYVPTDSPTEGDAVYLGRGDNPQHLGMVVCPCDATEQWVLHALEGSGVVCQPISTLSREGWKIKGFWTYAP